MPISVDTETSKCWNAKLTPAPFHFNSNAIRLNSIPIVDGELDEKVNGNRITLVNVKHEAHQSTAIATETDTTNGMSR